MSDTYGVTFSNCKAGNVVLAIYNLYKDGTYVINYDTYLNDMQAPLGHHKIPRRRGKSMVLSISSCRNRITGSAAKIRTTKVVTIKLTRLGRLGLRCMELKANEDKASLCRRVVICRLQFATRK